MNNGFIITFKFVIRYLQSKRYFKNNFKMQKNQLNRTDSIKLTSKIIVQVAF